MIRQNNLLTHRRISNYYVIVSNIFYVNFSI